ncbi:hydroxyethylthiazole kinase [Amphibacillus jilinensis]|uniref:hydroxyethylthiazole kinase n=1 Tax=Amphibacillus jilinensis TaxID=1216008 RepID=UPI00030A706E|nr:hydroxyethylthiazole kinase [Amphibacillus jilinensis]
MINTKAIIEAVKSQQPLVHNITNQVVMNFTANGLYALGAAPVMAHDHNEVAEMANNADALVLNIGTLTSELVEAMVIAGKSANQKGIPVVFDPVGVGATTLRNQAAERILSEVKLNLIRGNAGEISQLAGVKADVRGVDVRGDLDHLYVARQAVKKLDIPVMVTGQEDVVADAEESILVKNGAPILTQVTGTGCLLSAVTAAFLAVDLQTLEAATAAVGYYTVAAELANEQAKYPGQFQLAFLDALSYTTAEHVQGRLSVERVKGA